MGSWDSLIRFEATEDGSTYWASLPLDVIPKTGLSVEGFASIESLESSGTKKKVTVKKVGPHSLLVDVYLVVDGGKYVPRSLR